jgi:hypothetical protein
VFNGFLLDRRCTVWMDGYHWVGDVWPVGGACEDRVAGQMDVLKCDRCLVSVT